MHFVSPLHLNGSNGGHDASANILLMCYCIKQFLCTIYKRVSTVISSVCKLSVVVKFHKALKSFCFLLFSIDKYLILKVSPIFVDRHLNTGSF